MLNNLKAEMKRNGVSNSDIQQLLGISERAVRMKLDGETFFTYPEAETVRDRYFPGMRLEYLMVRTEKKAG